MSTGCFMFQMEALYRHPEVAALAGAASVHLAVRGPRRMTGTAPAVALRGSPGWKKPGERLRVTDHEMSALQ
jgi:hypothetical protein